MAVWFYGSGKNPIFRIVQLIHTIAFNGPLRRAGRQNMGRLEGKVAIVTGEELVIDCGHLIM